MGAPLPSSEELAAAHRINAWNDFVPHWLRFPLFLLIIVVFMFSGGVYMSAVTQMVGTTALLTEDVLMAGYASMIGLTVAFPVLFRIVFRFRTRDILLCSAAVFIVCDYISMVSGFVPLLVAVSFISGFFKIVSTFACWNNIQLTITPRRDFAVFFPFLFAFVLGSVQLVNIATGYSIYTFDWQAMHRLTIGAFIIIFAIVYFGMRRHYRQGPYMPFYGIDYLGGILWTLFLMCVVFICVYGDYYDWLDGEPIRVGAVFAVALLGISIHRASVVRHPYISLETFRQKQMLWIFLLFGFMTLMSATAGSVLNIFTEGILGYDARHAIDNSWGTLLGVASGAGFFYLGLVKLQWRIKSIVLAGFISFFIFQMMLYFLIDGSTEKWMLYPPLFFKGLGVGIVYTSLTYALAGCVSFIYYFQAMCVIGFIRTAFGGPLCSAIVTRVFKYVRLENFANLSTEIDDMNPMAESFSTVFGELQRQVLMVSLKEVFGYAVIASILIIILIMLSDYRSYFTHAPQKIFRLSHAQIWRLLRREV